MSLKDEFKVPLKCPGCGHTTTKSFRDLERSPRFRCVCGAQIEVGGQLAEINRSLGKLDANLKKLAR